MILLVLEGAFFVGKILPDNHTEVIDFACKICKKNLEYTKGGIVSKNILNKYFDYLISSYKYRGVIRKFILDFKFEDKKYLYEFLSYKLISLIKHYASNHAIDYIVYVPISFIRFYERGYNQSYILANEISHQLNIPILKYGLIKIKNNKRQSELTHIERINNIKNVYRFNHIYDIQGKVVLLVDDIYTTGNTVNECSRVLKENGAREIIVATVAIA